ncbi:hypothetical protein GGI02_005677, partial [Coemansia sp. RSA 2322]
MYGPIKAFISYVAHCVKAQLAPAGRVADSVERECRLMLPTDMADFKPKDGDDMTRIDIGLCSTPCDRPEVPKGRVGYYTIRAILEAKVSKSDIKNACVQLYEYTRQLYAEQHHLRFAWGITVCGTDVRVCRFGNDNVVASTAMDVATPGGRQAFIQLLVDWSLCNEAQLGRDTTMDYIPKLACWRVTCHDDSDAKIARDYLFTTVICDADRLFGRHTRCFLATDQTLTRKVTAGKPLKGTVVIKDAWAFGKSNADEDDRDEVKPLKKIHGSFSADKPADILYPEIKVGGRVRLKKGSDLIDDTTDMVYGGVIASDSKKIHFRAHRRIVMSPVGERLRTVKTVAEFITVVCDAMRCHQEILKRCKILHRDISDNNVLVVRRDGKARGLLIDFDCAEDLSKEKTDRRAEMTGTFP